MVDVNISAGLQQSNMQVKEQVTKFRQRYTLPEDVPLVIKPVVIIVLKSGHYFVTVFDYTSKNVFVLGRSGSKVGHTMEVNWEEWGGPMLWKCIAMLFGWSAPQFHKLEIQGVDWIQVCTFKLIPIIAPSQTDTRMAMIVALLLWKFTSAS
jgi:hypothetical protein